MFDFFRSDWSSQGCSKAFNGNAQHMHHPRAPLHGRAEEIYPVQEIECFRVRYAMAGDVKQPIKKWVQHEQLDLDQRDYCQSGDKQKSNRPARAFGQNVGIPAEYENRADSRDIKPMGNFLSDEALLQVAPEDFHADRHNHTGIKGEAAKPEGNGRKDKESTKRDNGKEAGHCVDRED
jgi:hypothetical protein